MAIEWYLMQPPYSQLSGYEDEAFNDFGTEGFLEALDSEIAVDVEIYKNDMTLLSTTKALVQDNLQETRLKTLNRQLMVPIGTIKAGMYVKYKGRFWLIIGLVDDNGVYEQGVMTICNYLLTWVNPEGEIIQRWANVSSASQYNNGETGNLFITLRDDQLLILLSDDDECLLLYSGIRFIIDHRCRIYEKSFTSETISDTSNPVVTYSLTRPDSVLFDYQDSGHYEFLATQDEQHDKDGYYVIDEKGYWLCEQPKSETDSEEGSFASIITESDVIYNGLDPGVFSSRFVDSNGEEISALPVWSVSCDFDDRLDIEEADGSILISVDDKSLINKSFILSLSADGYDTVSMTVYIRSFL